ncbi:hypothetical protein AGR13a_Cc330124 [Agrobacterium genomosp. 13 str. CFBP 6927]|uniref:Uncharacterized protein n=1 Tax=Agrobacterium genomosp. 13 str. CFBP 6927 TaxID=1183428 RepID=A0ABP2BJ98_9HYPH|nr:hypothetical protein AGR13a_Cc330124 [Agrobacterium genomosp. 13 str. CFBP 6927]
MPMKSTKLIHIKKPRNLEPFSQRAVVWDAIDLRSGGMPELEASLNDIELLVICGGRR